MTAKRPNSVRNLDNAIRRSVGPDQFLAARILLANALVGSMLPHGAVKGGTSLKLRFGKTATRFTTDLDAARAIEQDEFRSDLVRKMTQGWEGFTGRIVDGRQAHPKDVPAQYVMQPFDVKLSYLGKPWCTVSLEVGHDEIGDADHPEMVEPQEANALLEAIGFPPLGSIALMPLHFQIAQKLHGVSGPESSRAHDLIDLQVIVNNSKNDIDWKKVRETCERLFRYRRMQPWPPTVVEGKDWARLYQSQLTPSVLPTVEEAIVWVNELIAAISKA
jgi:predicted nucleotidyltransferase component of viral defense system